MRAAFQEQRSDKGVLPLFCDKSSRLKAAINLLWVLLSLLGALALARVVGILNPNEKVNGLWLVVAAGCIQPAMFMAVRREIGKSPARQARGAVRKGGILENRLLTERAASLPAGMQ